MRYGRRTSTLGRLLAGSLLAGTLGLAIFIDVEIIRSMGWFLGVLGLLALTGEAGSALLLRLNTVIGGLVLVICLLTSATLELTFYRQELSKQTEVREAGALKRGRLQNEITELTDRLWAGREKKPEIIRAEINQRLARRIRIGGRSTTVALATNNCAPTARLTRRFCSDILKHRTQLAISEATADLERKRDQKQRELDSLKPIGDLIPLARTIADLIRLRWEVSDADAESFIRVFFVIFIHTILLSTSWLCFSSQSSQNTASMKPASVEILPRSETQSPKLTLSLPKVPDGREIAEHFLKTRLKASKADHLDLKPTHNRYWNDCEAASCQPVALNIFSRMLADRQLHTKKTRGSKTGGTRFWGVTLTDGQ